MITQTTIKEPALVSGIGLHTGRMVTMALLPAPVDAGICFARTDLSGRPQVRADIDQVVATSREVTLRSGRATVHTVEHVLSALYALGVTNALIELDSAEPPVGDGSARLFVEAIMSRGIKAQNGTIEPFAPTQPHYVQSGDKSIVILPDKQFRVSFTAQFDHKLLGAQFQSLVVTPESYMQELALARTFGFLREFAAMWEQGKIQGGSVGNAVVIGEEQILNEAWRFPDEAVRHKILDFIGDLALLGRPVIGHCLVVKSGHTLDIEFVKTLRRTMLDA